VQVCQGVPVDGTPAVGSGGRQGPGPSATGERGRTRPLPRADRTPASPPPSAPRKKVFVAKLPRAVGEDDVRDLFSRYGRVYEVNLFRAFQVGGEPGEGGGEAGRGRKGARGATAACTRLTCSGPSR
jgi:hypothetical protein